MIKVIAKNYVKAGEIDKVLELGKSLVEATASDKGCISYDMFQDMKEPTVLIMVEEWETMEDLQNHMASKHFTQIVPQMSAYMSKEPEMNVCTKAF